MVRACEHAASANTGARTRRCPRASKDARKQAGRTAPSTMSVDPEACSRARAREAGAQANGMNARVPWRGAR
eukprot:15475859-Alexandrium_andersonii.AAC.1